MTPSSVLITINQTVQCHIPEDCNLRVVFGLMTAQNLNCVSSYNAAVLVHLKIC
jgi:hypothetical protein